MSLLRSLGRKLTAKTGEGEPPAGTASTVESAAEAAPVPEPRPALMISVLDLAREIIRGTEHFVLSTPDLDAPRFLDRLRRIAAQLTPAITPDEVEDQRKWAVDSLGAFGQLQRRYLSEREDEMWRLLSLYQDHVRMGQASNGQFSEAMHEVHDRMGDAIRLDDLRQVRERLQTEIQRATNIVEQKSRADEEKASVLAARVHQLEAALATARHEASRDPLTGVYHRGGFEPQLESALQSPQRCSLAMIDIDNFKEINDSRGHLVGDEILKMAVQLLGQVVRPGEIIGRFGGDEFCVLSMGISAQRLADRLDRLTQPRNVNFQFEERLMSVRLSMSVGVAGSAEGDTTSSLIQRADEALYEAKRGGKGRARVAEPHATVAA